MISLTHHRQRAVSDASAFSLGAVGAESDAKRSASVDSKLYTFGDIERLPKKQQNKASIAFLKAMEQINAKEYNGLVADAAKLKQVELEKFNENTPHFKLKVIILVVSERLRKPHRFLNIAELTAGITIRKHLLTFNPSMCLSPSPEVKETIAKELKRIEIS